MKSFFNFSVDAASTLVPFLPAGLVRADDVVSVTTKAINNSENVYSVYHEIKNGVTAYVGITKDFARRAGEHLRDSGRVIKEIPGLSNLTKFEARGAEQVLIEQHGLSKLGGTLANKINSISPDSSLYTGAVNFGKDLINKLE